LAPQAGTEAPEVTEREQDPVIGDRGLGLGCLRWRSGLAPAVPPGP
jgi:hypothetical protein